MIPHMDLSQDASPRIAYKLMLSNTTMSCVKFGVHSLLVIPMHAEVFEVTLSVVKQEPQILPIQAMG